MHSQVERRRCIHISEAERHSYFSRCDEVLEDVRVPGRRKQLGLDLIGQTGPVSLVCKNKPETFGHTCS